MDSFPAEFNAEKFFPAQPINLELSQIRQLIVARVNATVDWIGRSLQNHAKIYWSEFSDGGSVNMGVNIMNFRYLTIMDQELTARNFSVKYEIVTTCGGFDTVTYEQLDPFGTMPFAIVIGPKK